MPREIDEVKEQVATATRIMAEVGLATHILASLGHVSMRVPNQPDLFVVKGRGYALDALAVVKPEQMIVVDLDGNMVDGPPGTSQCYEVKMHSCILREQPNVQSVVHAHPRFTVLMSLLGIPLQPMCNEGAPLVRNELPMFPHSRLILSEDDGMGVVESMGDSKAVLPSRARGRSHRQEHGGRRHNHAPARRTGQDELVRLLRHGPRLPGHTRRGHGRARRSLHGHAGDAAPERPALTWRGARRGRPPRRRLGLLLEHRRR